MQPARTITKDSIPPDGWVSYRKRTLTRARRMQGPFTVQTREGLVTCLDGWLAIDAHGFPYPVHVQEFDAIYELAEPDPAGTAVAS